MLLRIQGHLCTPNTKTCYIDEHMKNKKRDRGVRGQIVDNNKDIARLEQLSNDLGTLIS